MTRSISPAAPSLPRIAAPPSVASPPPAGQRPSRRGKPMRVILPVGPGSGVDTIMRAAAPALGRRSAASRW